MRNILKILISLALAGVLACGDVATPNAFHTEAVPGEIPVGRGEASLTVPMVLPLGSSAQITLVVMLREEIDRRRGPIEYLPEGGQPREVAVRPPTDGALPQGTLTYEDIPIFGEMDARLDAPSFQFEERGWVTRKRRAGTPLLWSWNIRPLADGDGYQAVTAQVATGDTLLATLTMYPLITSSNEPIVTPPLLDYDPSSLSFFGNDGGRNPDSRFLTIWNVGGGRASWNVRPNQPWIEVTPNSGDSQGKQDRQQITISVDMNLLGKGSYSGSIIIEEANNPRGRHEVPIGIRVYDSLPSIAGQLGKIVLAAIVIVAALVTVLLGSVKIISFIKSLGRDN